MLPCVMYVCAPDLTPTDPERDQHKYLKLKIFSELWPGS